MPLYEYRCRDCEATFERFHSSAARPECPRCGGRKVAKLLSAFAVSSGSSRAKAADSSRGCGSCGDPRGPGSCALD